MNKLSSEKEIVKLEKKLGSEYADELRAMSTEELKKKLFELAKYRQEIEQAKKEDEELAAARRRANNLAAPYNDSKNDNDKRARLVYLIMQDERGEVGE